MNILLNQDRPNTSIQGHKYLDNTSGRIPVGTVSMADVYTQLPRLTSGDTGRGKSDSGLLKRAFDFFVVDTINQGLTDISSFGATAYNKIFAGRKVGSPITLDLAKKTKNAALTFDKPFVLSLYDQIAAVPEKQYNDVVFPKAQQVSVNLPGPLGFEINPADTLGQAVGQTAMVGATVVPVGRALSWLRRGKTGDNIVEELITRNADEVATETSEALKDIGGDYYKDTLKNVKNKAGQTGDEVLKIGLAKEALKKGARGSVELGLVSGVYSIGDAMNLQLDTDEIIKAGAYGTAFGALLGFGGGAALAGLSASARKLNQKLVDKFNDLDNPDLSYLNEQQSKKLLQAAKEQGKRTREFLKIKDATDKANYIPTVADAERKKLTELSEELAVVNKQISTLTERADVKSAIEKGKRSGAIDNLEANKARIEAEMGELLQAGSRGYRDPDLIRQLDEVKVLKSETDSFLTATAKRNKMTKSEVVKAFASTIVPEKLKGAKAAYARMARKLEVAEIKAQQAKDYRKTPEGKKAFGYMVQKERLQSQLKGIEQDLALSNVKKLSAKERDIKKQITELETKIKEIETPPKEIQKYLKAEAKLEAVKKESENLTAEIAKDLGLPVEKVKEAFSYTFKYYEMPKSARKSFTQPAISVILPDAFIKASRGFNDISGFTAKFSVMGFMQFARKIDGETMGMFYKTIARPLFKAVSDKYSWQATMKQAIAKEIGQPSLGANSAFASSSQRFGLKNAKANTGKNSIYSEYVQKVGEEVDLTKDAFWNSLSKQDQDFVKHGVSVYRKYYDQFFDEINKALVATGRPPLKKTDNYFRRMREEDMLRQVTGGDMELGQALKGDVALNMLKDEKRPIAQTGTKRGTSLGGIEKERTRELAEIYDAARGMSNYIDIAAAQIHLRQPIDTLREAATWLGPNANKWLNNFTNQLTGELSPIDSILGKGTLTGLRYANYLQSVVGTSFSVMTSLMQLAITPVYAADVGAKYFLKGLIGASKEMIEDQSKSAYQISRIMKPDYSLGKTKYEAFNYYGNYLNANLDAFAVAHTWRANYIKGKEAGITNRQALIEYADIKTRALHGETSPILTPLPLRSQIVKFFVPFQNFTVNFYNYLSKEMPAKIADESAFEFLRASTLVIGAMAYTNKAYEELGMPVPYGLGAYVPYYGIVSNIAQGNTNQGFVGIKPGNFMVKATSDLIAGIANQDADKVLSVLNTTTPSQLRKIVGTLEAMFAGGDFSGIGTDETKFYLENDIATWLQSAFIGPYSTPGGIQYIEDLPTRDFLDELRSKIESQGTEALGTLFGAGMEVLEETPNPLNIADEIASSNPQQDEE
jgi:hypothetical protein